MQKWKGSLGKTMINSEDLLEFAPMQAQNEDSCTPDSIMSLSGRNVPLFDFKIELNDIFCSQLRLELWDDNRDELLGSVTFSVRHMFEVDFGLKEFCHYRELMPPTAEELALKEAVSSSLCCPQFGSGGSSEEQSSSSVSSVS